MTLKEKLLKRLPNKYHEVVEDFDYEDGLIDNCRYMLYFTDKYSDNYMFGSCVPCCSIKEAVDFVKEVY